MTDTTDPTLANPRALLRHLYDVAVQRAQPLQGLKEHLPAPPKGRTLVLGAGKAGGSMAQALEALWPADAPLSGLVVTRYDHIPPRPTGLAQRIEVVEAAHPVPDAAGLQAAERMLARLAQHPRQRRQIGLCQLIIANLADSSRFIVVIAISRRQQQPGTTTHSNKAA